MTASEVDPVLRQTLSDTRVSPSEKKQFLEWLTTHGATESDLAFIRSRAFAIASEAMHDPQSKQIVGWLEAMIKLTQSPPPVPVEEGKAFFAPGQDCVREVIRQFDNARLSCDVCVFTITDDRITTAIFAAHRRRIKVRIITDDEKSKDEGSDVERMKAAGIPCVLDQDPAHMHHKFALFDGRRLLTGSFNWTRSATEHNEENLIVTPDHTLVAAFTERFEKLWAKMNRRSE